VKDGIFKMEQARKTYVITGATSGIGYATAKRLADSGAFTIGIGRSTEKCNDAENTLRKATNNPDIHYLVADLSRQNEVKRVAEQTKQLLTSIGYAQLDGLVNNAGVFTYWMTLTQDGIEMQWAVNHMAAFILTNELLPLIKNAKNGRIVTVSSDSHYSGKINWNDPQCRKNYNGLKAYENTKLANVLFTFQLNQLLQDDTNVKAFAADPGLVKTEIGFKNIPPALRWIWKLRSAAGTSVEIPVNGIEYLLLEPSLDHSHHIYWKDSHIKHPKKQAINEDTALKLWQYSETLYGKNE
jgi:retinol dehydrogenase 12